jgi:hypothetical protein
MSSRLRVAGATDHNHGDDDHVVGAGLDPRYPPIDLNNLALHVVGYRNPIAR